jgi:hypothetical protein
VNEADPHPQYQKESEKGAANGYASLDGTGNVPLSQLGNAPAGGGGADASSTVKGISKLSLDPVSATDPIAVGDNDPRNSDERVPTDGSVTAAKVDSSLKPSGTAASTDESLRRLGTGSTHAAAGDDSRFPTAGQKNALAGTSGVPGTGNEYVTTQDSRMTDARTPTAHAASHASAGSDPITVAESQVTGLVADLAAKAPLASPALTGTPTVPTAAQGTNTTQAASTAYVQTETGLLIPKSLVDAKGDLLVGTADNTVARKPIGADGQVLTARSSDATGLAWETLPAGGASNGIGASAYATTTQTIPTLTYTAFALNAEDFDDAAIHDTAVNNTRFTIPAGKGGIWSFAAHANFATGGKKAIGFRLNGSAYRNFHSAPGTTFPGGGMADALSTAGIFRMAAGEYLEFVAICEGAQTTVVSALDGVRLEATYEGP